MIQVWKIKKKKKMTALIVASHCTNDFYYDRTLLE